MSRTHPDETVQRLALRRNQSWRPLRLGGCVVALGLAMVGTLLISSEVVAANHEILKPVDGASFDEQDSIAFMARPEDLDLEDSSVVMAPDELRWTSSIDGAIGVGPAFQARLSPGLHRITVASVHGEFARVQITVLGTGSVSAAGEDADADGWPDNNDNCPSQANPNQTNTDGDGEGDLCDVTPLPEPGALAMLISGGLMLGFLAKRRRVRLLEEV